MNGVDIYSVNKLMRHETLQVTKSYAHLKDAHLQQTVERWWVILQVLQSLQSLKIKPANCSLS